MLVSLLGASCMFSYSVLTIPYDSVSLAINPIFLMRRLRQGGRISAFIQGYAIRRKAGLRFELGKVCVLGPECLSDL